MAISRKYVLTIDGYKIKLSSDLTFYRNDALHLIFSVNEYGVMVKNGVTTKSTMPIYPLSAVLLVETPENRDYIESASVNEDEIHFHIGSEYTSHVGISRMQIILIDEDCCQITLPEFNFEVRNNIYDDEMRINELYLLDENDSKIVTENNESIIVERSIGQSKEIRDLVETTLIDGTEDMIIQDINGKTKRVKSGTICTTIIEEISNPFNITINGDVTIAELGSIINRFTLTWNYNREIITQSLNDINLGLDVREQSYTNIRENKTFILNAKSVMGVERTVKFNVSFANGIYYGKSKNDVINDTLFNDLTKELSNNKSRTVTVNAGKDEYIYYCYPQRLGTSTFTVNGFDGGFNLIGTFKFKNSSNYEEDYNIYKSTNANLGNTTITII